MNARKIGYWVTTGLTAAAFTMGGLMDLMKPADLMAGMAQLGYPSYFVTILGAWKVLGALAIVAPKLPRLKEWAYAGMIFDLTGAAFSHAAMHEGANKIVTPLVLAGLVAASWALRPEGRMLGSIALVKGGRSPEVISIEARA
ncbi:MAG: DoxX family protein [Polyangiaceae bacterium]